jgi:predicted nucleic acid-binding protein
MRVVFDANVTYDRDLLDLEKPFGIAIVRPSRLLVMLGAGK